MELQKNRGTSPKNLMFKYEKNNYITDLNKIAIPGDKLINFPINFDTEYQSPDFLYRISDDKLLIEEKELICPTAKKNRIPITCQISGIFEDKGKIYAYPDFKKFNDLNKIGEIRHEILDDDVFIPLEYLKSKITDFRYILSDDKNKIDKTLVVTIYGFFLTAEIALISTGNDRSELRRIIKLKDLKGGKRLTTGNLFSDYVKTNYVCNWNSFKYGVGLRLIDLAAIHGVASYHEVAKNVGHELKYKDNFTSELKSKMIITYFKKPDQFDEYALGDLDCYKMLEKNVNLKRQIYKDLDIELFYKNPKLTIGSEVSELLESVMMKKINIDPENYKKSEIYNYILKICQKDNLTFKKFKNEFFRIFGETNTGLLSNRLDTGCFLAKVLGGRCYNNRNTERHIKSIMIDLDIAGCYGNGLMNQDYPLGYPTFITKPLNYNVKPLPLKNFLDDYKNELIPGLWLAVFSTTENLEYSQDFFPSWIDYQFENHELKVKSGITKIFQKTITNGVLTEDGLDFVKYTMSNKQRSDFFKKTIVVSAVFYPSSKKVESIDDLISKNDDKYWTSINLGDLIIKKLLLERKKYPKGSSLNTQFKLMINTTYGDIVSPYFNISNSLVGNNITARARALCYYMEKGLNGFQSITDGVCFEVEKVLFPSNRNDYLNGVDLTNHKNRKYGKLFESNELVEKYTYLKNNPELKEEKSQFDNYINQSCFNHLKNIFHPEIRIFKYKQFQFEYKEIIKEATFMGSSDYKFTYLDNTEKIKKRSYSEKKMKFQIEKVENGWLKLNDYPNNNIPKKIMSDLEKSELEINPPGLQFQILKISEYKKNSNKYDIVNLLPGDTIPKIVIPKSISISQIKYNNVDDYKTIKKLNDSLIRKNNLGIASLLFLNNKIKFNPEFFINPFKFIKDVNILNPYQQLIVNIKKMFETFTVQEFFENADLEIFDFFGDDDYEFVDSDLDFSNLESNEDIIDEWF